MALAMFLRGGLIGFSIAATVGPMAILCIRRTIERGQLAGLVTGLGVASADGCYGAVAGFGLTAISSVLVAEQFWLRLLGGLFLCYLGLRSWQSAPAARAAALAERDLWRSYLSAFALTLTNPMTILSFAAIFAGLGAGARGNGYAEALLLVLGVLCGSVCWWIILSSVVAAARSLLTPRLLQWINRLSGAIILAFGLVALAGLR